MTEIEYQATLQDYFNDGLEKGMAKGMTKGMAKGEAIGAEKREQQFLEAMRRQGYTEEQIAALRNSLV